MCAQLCQARAKGQAALSHSAVRGGGPSGATTGLRVYVGGGGGGALLHVWHTPSVGVQWVEGAGLCNHSQSDPSPPPETNVGAGPSWPVHPQEVSGRHVWASACWLFTSCRSVLSPASAQPGRWSQTGPELMGHQKICPPPMPDMRLLFANCLFVQREGVVSVGILINCKALCPPLPLILLSPMSGAGTLPGTQKVVTKANRTAHSSLCFAAALLG